MTDPWVPTPIVGPELIQELAPQLFQYAVRIEFPIVGPPSDLGEETLIWEVYAEHMPAMIGTTLGAVLQEKITPELTMNSRTVMITFGDYLPDVDNSFRVVDEQDGQIYELVSIAHPVRAMTQAMAIKYGTDSGGV